jgi:hypothetical protein
VVAGIGGRNLISIAGSWSAGRRKVKREEGRRSLFVARAHREPGHLCCPRG